MAITKEEIFKAADQLLASGQQPTLAKVRAALGGGSFSTISTVMTEWKAARNSLTPSREPAPQVIAERLEGLGREIWAVALEWANARLSAERDALATAKEEVEEFRQQATDLADLVTTEIERVHGELSTVTAQAKSAEQESLALRSQLAGTQEQLNTAQARVVEIGRRADNLKGALTAAQDAAKAANEQHAAEIKAARAELEKARKDAAQAREDAARLRGNVEVLQTQVSDLTRAQATAKQAVSKK